MPSSPTIEIRHLRTFLAVAETENFTRSAERLGISQPSISQQVKELETALRTVLFHRNGPRVRLTAVGHTFRDRAAIVLSKFSEACQSVADVEGLLFGHLDVGVIPALDVPWVPPVLERMAVEHPGIVVSVHERSSSDVETEVEAGRYEVGLGILSRTSPNLRYERLREDALCLVVPADHEAAKKSVVPLSVLADQRLVLLPPSFVLRHMVDESLRRANVRARIAFELDTIDALVRASARCGMPTLLPSIVLEGRETLGLVAVPVSSWTPKLELGLFWQRDADPAPAARAFGELMRQHVGAPAKTGPRRAKRS